MPKFRIIERRTTAHIAPPLRKPWTDQDRAALVRKLRGLGFTVTAAFLADVLNIPHPAAGEPGPVADLDVVGEDDAVRGGDHASFEKPALRTACSVWAFAKTFP